MSIKNQGFSALDTPGLKFFISQVVLWLFDM